MPVKNKGYNTPKAMTPKQMPPPQDSEDDDDFDSDEFEDDSGEESDEVVVKGNAGSSAQKKGMKVNQGVVVQAGKGPKGTPTPKKGQMKPVESDEEDEEMEDESDEDEELEDESEEDEELESEESDEKATPAKGLTKKMQQQPVATPGKKSVGPTPQKAVTPAQKGSKTPATVKLTPQSLAKGGKKPAESDDEEDEDDEDEEDESEDDEELESEEDEDEEEESEDETPVKGPAKKGQQQTATPGKRPAQTADATPQKKFKNTEGDAKLMHTPVPMKLDKKLQEEIEKRRDERNKCSLFFKVNKRANDEDIKALSSDILYIKRANPFAKFGWLSFASEQICKKNYEKLLNAKVGDSKLIVDFCTNKPRSPNKPVGEYTVDALALHVGNLPKSISEGDLKRVFPSAKSINTRTFKRGFTFVNFETPEAARQALDKSKTATISGNKIQVSFARLFEKKKPQSGGTKPQQGAGQKQAQKGSPGASPEKKMKKKKSKGEDAVQKFAAKQSNGKVASRT